MLLKIHARDFELSNALDEYTQSQLRLNLNRFQQQILRADVYLSDVNGPRGGEDKLCKVVVKMASASDPIVTRELAEDMYQAIKLCGHRLKKAVSRSIKRDRTIARRHNTIRLSQDPDAA